MVAHGSKTKENRKNYARHFRRFGCNISYFKRKTGKNRWAFSSTK